MARSTNIRAQHALASAAIPLLFPAIEIEGAYYCDGGVRQNTPLSPALRLGADKVLIVGLRADDPEPVTSARLSDEDQEPYPGPMFLVGKLIDSIMLDRLDYDLKRLEGFNTLLKDGSRLRRWFRPDGGPLGECEACTLPGRYLDGPSFTGLGADGK